MTENIAQLETRVDRLWSDFLEARERAWQSKDVADARTAGRAWAAFLNEFAPAAHKSKFGGAQ